MNGAFTLSLAVAVAVSCGNAPRPGPVVPSNTAPSETLQQTPGAQRPGAVRCPSGRDLDRVARRTWNAGAGELAARCVAITHAGKPLWFITGTFASGNSFGETFGKLMRSIVSPDGNTVWSSGFHSVVPLSDLGEWANDHFKAVDLDGDGDDEILHEEVAVIGGHQHSVLRVLQVSSEVEEIESFDLSGPVHDDDGRVIAGHCDGRYSIVHDEDDFTFIEVTLGPQCDNTGVHRFRFDGQRFHEED